MAAGLRNRWPSRPPVQGAFRTPINAVRRTGGYVIALTYGPGADRVKKVLAAGSCELEVRGRRVVVVQPRPVRDPHQRLVPAPVRPICAWLASTSSSISRSPDPGLRSSGLRPPPHRPGDERGPRTPGLPAIPGRPARKQLGSWSSRAAWPARCSTSSSRAARRLVGWRSANRRHRRRPGRSELATLPGRGAAARILLVDQHSPFLADPGPLGRLAQRTAPGAVLG